VTRSTDTPATTLIDSAAADTPPPPGITPLPLPAGEVPVPSLELPPAGKIWRAGTLTYTRGGLITLFLCLLGGDFFWQLRERALAPTIPVLLRQFGASDFMTALLQGTIAPALAIFLAPVISYRSDRYRSRLGRRIPFLLVATPPAFLAMMGLALSPWLGRWAHQLLGSHSPGIVPCVIGMFTIAWLVFDVAVIMTNCVHGALVNDVVPREVMGTFFGWFRFGSLGAGMLFMYFLVGKIEQHYVAIFLGIGLFYLVCFTVMCLLVREGEYPPPPPAGEGGPLASFFEAAAAYFRECLTKKYYLWFFLSFFLAYMAFQPINLFSVYFSESVGMSKKTYGYYSTIQFALSLAQAPLVGWLADKVHPLRLTILALLFYGLTTGVAYLYVHDAGTFAAAHVICGTISGFWLTATAPLAPALLPKLKFATFASALIIAQSLAQIVASPIIGWIVVRVNHGRPPELRNYHVIYAWACVFITLSMLVTLIVHRYFMQYGGRKNYVAPE
jgi:MFS family permease